MDRKTPRILAQPSVIYLGTIVIGFFLDRIFHTGFLPLSLRLTAGIPITLISIGLSALTFRTFIKHGASVDHKKPTEVLITTGPFRISRNPLYLSGVILVFGMGLMLNSLWILGMLIPSTLLVQYGAIQPEEAYLLAKFDKKYVKYRSTVRRWL
jgi:protein-S-isoprenylcysteine O-methyltransferase Ste14